MNTERPDHAKLDEDLLRLLGEGFAGEAEFPIVLTARPDELSDVVQLIQSHGGRIRHELTALAMVSAWLTLPAATAITASDHVLGLELVQATRMPAGQGSAPHQLA